ncbi:hypothetical protein A2797_00675 [candidate division WWE3 bacterium RIFCSPHIGHO2_01_FULL_48_15]|uniref:GIY-YIG domain-containing protein n=1 Tax=candidate division WWE3 bacterium RIFCSPHIGHO2_01_FULL_48_15 TaxID=1802619 RepID=A0A1F4VBB3_UNCKA|nr:MAG: hypothetical protein A2797_00675 [candidate division WWE3 bacterium RIFCSPHIGHO2_01_FULL_48_15]
MHYVYLLLSQKDGNFYTGVTSDLHRRVQEHNDGKNLSTKSRVPLDLVYYEAYKLKADAEARERYLKTSMGKRVIKKQLAHYLDQIGRDKISYGIKAT